MFGGKINSRVVLVVVLLLVAVGWGFLGKRDIPSSPKLVGLEKDKISVGQKPLALVVARKSVLRKKKKEHSGLVSNSRLSFFESRGGSEGYRSPSLKNQSVRLRAYWNRAYRERLSFYRMPPGERRTWLSMLGVPENRRRELLVRLAKLRKHREVVNKRKLMERVEIRRRIGELIKRRRDASYRITTHSNP